MTHPFQSFINNVLLCEVRPILVILMLAYNLSVIYDLDNLGFFSQCWLFFWSFLAFCIFVSGNTASCYAQLCLANQFRTCSKLVRIKNS